MTLSDAAHTVDLLSLRYRKHCIMTLSDAAHTVDLLSLRPGEGGVGIFRATVAPPAIQT